MNEEVPRTVSVGDITLRIADIVRNPRGIEKLVADIVKTEWPVSRLREANVYLTPFPKPVDLYDWDSLLFRRYEPVYVVQSEVCYDCALGPCDLSLGKRGGCGGDNRCQQARNSLLMSCMGASSSVSYARQLYDYAISNFNEYHPLTLGRKINYRGLQTSIITGLPEPSELGELEQVLKYLESQLTNLLSSTIPGMQSNHLELESMALHAGTLTHLSQEVSEIIKISCFNFFTTGDLEKEEISNALEPKTPVGIGSVDTSKPVIMFVGHNVVPAVELVNLIKDQKLEEKVEICGVGSVGMELPRILESAKIVGPATRLLLYLRLGLADVILVDNLCVKIDLVYEADRSQTAVIATSETSRYDLEDKAGDPSYQIVRDLVEGKQKGVLISDPVKAAEVGLEVALELKGRREKRQNVDLKEISEKCRQSDECVDLCPFQIPIAEAVKSADIEKLREVYNDCVFCGFCENISNLRLIDLIIQASEDRIMKENFLMRKSRGPIGNQEIMEIKSSLDLGKVPGIITIIGCGKYPSSSSELIWMVNEFLEQNYMVLISGCSAIEIAMSKDEEQRNPYEVNHAFLKPKGLINMGACTTSTNISSGYFKFACVGEEIPMRANYMELADYILSTTNSVVIVWSACEELIYSAVEGYARMGIPVILGPSGSKNGRYLMSNMDSRETFWAIEKSTGDKICVEPAPEHLIAPVETKEQAVTTAAKLCIRPNDSREGRASRIDSYTSFMEKYFNKLPEDVNHFIREERDLPLTKKRKIIKLLKECSDWEIDGEKVLKVIHPVTGERLRVQEYVNKYGVKIEETATLLKRLAVKTEK